MLLLGIYVNKVCISVTNNQRHTVKGGHFYLGSYIGSAQLYPLCRACSDFEHKNRTHGRENVIQHISSAAGGQEAESQRWMGMGQEISYRVTWVCLFQWATCELPPPNPFTSQCFLHLSITASSSKSHPGLIYWLIWSFHDPVTSQWLSSPAESKVICLWEILGI